MKTAHIHWSQRKEQTAGYWHVKLMHILFKLFPVIIMRIIAFPVGFFYFIFAKNARVESKRFLQKAAAVIDDDTLKKKCLSPFGPLRHIVSFSLTLIEKIESWGGKFRFTGIHFQDDAIGELIDDLENGKGVFIITSHLGNMELLRGLASLSRTGVSRKVKVTGIIDQKVSRNFTRMLKELNPQSDLDIISAQAIGPDTAALLEEKLAAGEIVSVAGDRTAAGKSAGQNEKNLMINFLGEEAPFSPGPFYLAALMQAPVYMVIALRRGDLSLKPEYDMHVHKSPAFGNTAGYAVTRKERRAHSEDLARFYAEMLERYCKQNPFQWYNFFDFWAKGV